MQEYLMEWMINIAVFSIISSLILKLLPGKGYLPYGKWLTGIMIILLFLTPVLEFFHWDKETEQDVLEMGEQKLTELEQEYWEILGEYEERQEFSE